MMRMLVAIMLAVLVSGAGAKQESTHAKELREQHRAVAAAHLAAAQCLESGKSEEACHQELHEACRRLPMIGSLCGMRKHRH